VIGLGFLFAIGSTTTKPTTTYELFSDLVPPTDHSSGDAAASVGGDDAYPEVVEELARPRVQVLWPYDDDDDRPLLCAIGGGASPARMGYHTTSTADVYKCISQLLKSVVQKEF